MQLRYDKAALPSGIVIFGASGDLAQRKLVPALYALLCEGLLSPDVRVIGVARSDFTDDQFRDRLREGIAQYARLKHTDLAERWPECADQFTYLQGDYDDPDTYRRIGERLATFDSNSRSY